MFALLQILFVGHAHKWDEVDRSKLIGEAYTGRPATIGVVVDCRCSVCGKPKRFVIKN